MFSYDEKYSCLYEIGGTQLRCLCDPKPKVVRLIESSSYLGILVGSIFLSPQLFVGVCQIETSGC